MRETSLRRENAIPFSFDHNELESFLHRVDGRCFWNSLDHSHPIVIESFSATCAGSRIYNYDERCYLPQLADVFSLPRVCHVPGHCQTPGAEKCQHTRTRV